MDDIQGHGCPSKYLPQSDCGQPVGKWEEGEVAEAAKGDGSGNDNDSGNEGGDDAGNEGDDAGNGGDADDAGNGGDSGRLLSDSFYCINTACCGVVGQLYSDPYLHLSNFSLYALLAACLISVGCYYFWYVSWVDTQRDKEHDWIWVLLKSLFLIAFVICIFVYHPAGIQTKPE